MYEHLLVALDGSRLAERVLEHAQAIAAAFGSSITLLRATVGPETVVAETAGTGQGMGIGDMTGMVDPRPIVEADRAEAVAYLNEVAGRLRQHQLAVNVDDAQGPAAETIVERATSLGVSLILMTTHGRSGLKRLVFGSVADSVLRHAACPVLLVHVTDADPESDQQLSPP